MTWSESDWNTLAEIVFRPDYPGYTPTVVESPNGDVALDTGKRYAHVANTYLVDLWARTPEAPEGEYEGWVLADYLWRAHDAALRIYESMGAIVGHPIFPEFGALRVLEYPAGVGSAVHTDFDLFTVNLWRNCANPGLPATPVHMGELGELLGLGPATPHRVDPLPVVQKSLVYFALPDHAAILPSGVSVGEWVAERKARSRIVTKRGEK